MHDGIESEAKGAKLLFLYLLERAPDFAAFTVMNAPAEAMAQFGMVELGQDAPAERRGTCQRLWYSRVGNLGLVALAFCKRSLMAA